MPGVLRWHGDRILEDMAVFEAEVAQEVVEHLEAKLKQKISRPATYLGGGKWIGSATGEPPKKRSGWLWRNIFSFVQRGLGRLRGGKAFIAWVGVGKSAPYGEMLDRGTATIKPRPWIGVTIWQELGNLRGLIRRKRFRRVSGYSPGTTYQPPAGA